MFNRVSSRLKFLAEHSATGALLWNFEQISIMADEYLLSYSEVRLETADELQQNEVTDEELYNAAMGVDGDLLELSDEDFAKAGVNLELANQIETWRPNFDQLRRKKGFTITLRQRRRLRQMLRTKKLQKSGAPPDIESGFVKVYIPNQPAAQQYTVSKLDRCFRPDLVRAKEAGAWEATQAEQSAEEDDSFL